MKHKLLLSQAILAIALVFLTCAALFGQCTITVTDGQPYIEDFESDGFDCWTVEIDGGSWTPLAGTESTVVSFTHHDNGDEARLISPVLDMSAVESATFSFSYAMMGIYQNDELEVCYRSSEKMNGIFWVLIAKATITMSLKRFLSWRTSAPLIKSLFWDAASVGCTFSSTILKLPLR